MYIKEELFVINNDSSEEVFNGFDPSDKDRSWI